MSSAPNQPTVTTAAAPAPVHYIPRGEREISEFAGKTGVFAVCGDYIPLTQQAPGALAAARANGGAGVCEVCTVLARLNETLNPDFAAELVLQGVRAALNPKTAPNHRFGRSTVAAGGERIIEPGTSETSGGGESQRAAEPGNPPCSQNAPTEEVLGAWLKDEAARLEYAESTRPGHIPVFFTPEPGSLNFEGEAALYYTHRVNADYFSAEMTMSDKGLAPVVSLELCLDEVALGEVAEVLQRVSKWQQKAESIAREVRAWQRAHQIEGLGQ